jgi:hypothetical protein
MAQPGFTCRHIATLCLLGTDNWLISNKCCRRRNVTVASIEVTRNGTGRQ